MFTREKMPHVLAAAFTVSSLLAASSASAATYTWANSNVNNTTPKTLDWLTGGSNTQGTWDTSPGAQGSSLITNADTVQFFANTTTPLTNTVAVVQNSIVNNGGTAVQLSALTLSGFASSTNGANLTMNLSGDALNFSAAAGTINLNALNNGSRSIIYSVANNIQLGTASSASNLTLTGSGTSAFSLSGNFTELQTGGGSKLIKSGTSTATLSGAVTVSGGVEVNGGLLSLTGSSNAITGGITLDNGGTLNYGAASTINGNNISANGVATLRSTSSANPSSNANIILNAGANLSLSADGGSQTFSSAVTGEGSLTITRYGSGSGTFVLSSTANTFTGGITFANQGNTLSLTLNSLVDSVGAGNIAFTGTNTGPSYLFILGSGASAPLTLNNRRIEFTSTSTTGGVLANNSSQAFTINTDLLVSSTSTPTLALRGTGSGISSFNGVIGNGSGTVGITKSESGTWVLGNSANTYTGTTTIAGGTLTIDTLKSYGVASSLGAPTSGDVIFNKNQSSALIYVGSGDTTNRTIRHEPDVSNRNNGSGIYNNGTGALIFNGSTFNTPFVASGNGGRTTTFNLGGTYTGDANEIGGVIANNDSVSLIAITKIADTSIWELSGANTYSGGNTINGGTLRGTQTSGAPFGTGAVTINAGILSLAPTGSGSAVSVTGGTKASGTLFTYNAGAAISLARGSQNSLTYTFGGTGATTSRGTNGTLILSTSDTANFGTAGSKTERFIMNGTAPTQVNTIVSGVVIQDRDSSNAGDFAAYDGTDGFTKATYTLNNTFSGSSNTSLVEITSATSTGNISSYAIKANATVDNSGTITLGNGSNPAALILNGGSISGGTLKSAATGAEFLIYTSGASSISSAITTSTSGMSVFGPGSLTLSSSNSFTGGLRVNNSTLVVSNDNQLGGANNALTLRGGTLQTSGASLAIGAGARAITLAAGQDQTGGTFNVTAGTTTFQNNSSSSRIISGSGSLTKTGAGALVLSGNTANTYSGGTFVNQGTLLVNNTTGSGTGTGPVTVSGNATLGGTGTISGAVTVKADGTIAAGNSPGILNTGSLTLEDSGILAVQADGTVAGTLYDQVSVTGTVSIAGDLNLSLGYAPTLGEKLFVIKNDGTDGIVGTGFGNLGVGNSIDVTYSSNTYRFVVSYAGDADSNSDTGGNDVVLTNVVVPEPTTLGLLAMGAVGLMRRRRVA